MSKKKSDNKGCGIAMIVFFVILMWFLPEFIASGGEFLKGFEYLLKNIFFLLVFAVIGFFFFLFFEGPNSK